jgi:UDP-galactopyranose mutase
MAKKKETTLEENKVEPIVLDCGKAIDGKVFKGNTFEMVKTNKGILYHVYGGYNIFVTPNNTALYETFEDLIDNQGVYEKLTGEEKEAFELNLSAITYVLDIPLFAFSNAEFCFKIAEETIKYLQAVYENSMNQPLQEETVDKDLQFKEAVLAMEEIQSAFKEEKTE